VDELIALLGQHWRLLLIYPGGLTALGGMALARLLLESRSHIWRSRERWNGRDIMIAAIWLLVIALLPLPQTSWPYALDLIVCLLLIEVPHWTRTCSSRSHDLDAMIAQLASLLNVYPLLALSIAALGQGAGSLVVQEINRSSGLLHWAGIVGWASVLPPLLGLGPWRDQSEQGTLPALRRIAHIGLLLAAALPAHNETPQYHSAIGLAGALLSLAALNRWWRDSPERWIGWQPWLVAVFAVFVAWTSGQTLLTRLR
jgi:hypothetical protein